MYQPPHFRETDLGTLHALIRAHPLGLLITSGPEGPNANPIPFHLDSTLSAKGALQAHLAKANGQWREIHGGAAPLVVFQGADTYVTPSWYATKRETGKVVPTWNYAMVQARGRARVIDDAVWLKKHVETLTAGRETGRRIPWAVDDAPAEYVTAQLKGIIGIEIEITDIEGKWKVSQNRPASDRETVISGLQNPEDPHANPEMAQLVRRYGRP